MDRLAQRLGAQDMITANAQAEAKETEGLRQQVMQYEETVSGYQEQVSAYQEQVSDYEQLLQQVRTATQQSEEGTARMEQLLARLESQMDQLQTDDEGAEEAERTVSRIQEFSHRENVKVYRNVQAALIEELGKQTEALQEATRQLMQDQTARLQEISEALMEQEDPAQSEALVKMGETVSGGLKRQTDDLHAQMERILNQQNHLEEKMDVIMNDLKYLRLQDLKGRKNLGVIILQLVTILFILVDSVLLILRVLGMV